jgi:hypothetical protein
MEKLFFLEFVHINTIFQKRPRRIKGSSVSNGANFASAHQGSQRRNRTKHHLFTAKNNHYRVFGV